MEITYHVLDELWEDSDDAPLELFGSQDPDVTAGTYVIRPGERVPEEGFTSHDGHELSVIMAGQLTVGTSDGEAILEPGTLVIIPSNVAHYSENRGNSPVKLVYTVLDEL